MMLVPNSDSPTLTLDHPTIIERIQIWKSTFFSWGDSLTLSAYLEESQYLTTIPLAEDGGMTLWILVDKNEPPNQRRILSSCETFRKRSLTSNAEGNVSNNIIHGVASVFCPPEYRGHGYAGRLMRELRETLRSWQLDGLECVGSILYSDIGKTYYAKLGWLPNIENSQIELQAEQIQKSPLVKDITIEDLPGLCVRDEERIRRAMALPAKDIKARMTIVPDIDHMLWHISKEEFACNRLFDEVPPAKGAMAGPPAEQVWAIWTHRYYGHPEKDAHNNVLYIQRLVMEADETATRIPCDRNRRLGGDKEQRQTEYLKAVLEAAQAEAAEWKLNVVKIWDPTPFVLDMITRMDIQFEVVEREEESIASCLWYEAVDGDGELPSWINNEHYAWV